MCVCENCTTVKGLHLYFLSKYVCLNPAIIPLNHSRQTQSCGWGEWISGEQLTERVLVVNKRQVSAGFISRLIPLLLPSACLPGPAPACLPQLTLLLLLPSPQPQGLSEQGLHLPPPKLCVSTWLLLSWTPSYSSFTSWSHPLWAADCFSLWLRPIPFGQLVSFSPPALSLSFPRKLVPLSLLPGAFE